MPKSFVGQVASFWDRAVDVKAVSVPLSDWHNPKSVVASRGSTIRPWAVAPAPEILLVGSQIFGLNDLDTPRGLSSGYMLEDTCSAAGLSRARLFAALRPSMAPVLKPLIPMLGLRSWLSLRPL